MWVGKEANIVQKRGLRFAKNKGGDEDTDMTARQRDHRQAQKEADPTSLWTRGGRFAFTFRVTDGD